MARIAGVELPNKRLEIALTYIFGIGLPSSREILKKLGFDHNRRINDLNEQEISRIREMLEKDYTIEGSLKQQVRTSIQRLADINCYRGIRHRRGLPVRGQRTRTNAHNRKGKGKAIANKKIATK